MKVSVIIPAYNEEARIARTLQAVLKQHYDNFEVIVVDNNSSDKTAEIARSFPKVIVLKEPRQGVQFARECGRKMATGDIIANLDADCLPGPDWIATAMRYLKDSKVVSVSGPYDYYDGKLLFRIVSNLAQKICYKTQHLLMCHLFHTGAIIMGGNVFIRASALKSVGGYNTSIKFYGDDTDTAKRLLPWGKIAYTGAITVRSSARRFKKLGVFKTFWKYAINYVWVLAFNQPYDKQAIN